MILKMLKAIENGTWPTFKYFNENFLWYKKRSKLQKYCLKNAGTFQEVKL